MAREYDEYRTVLAALIEQFGQGAWIKVADIARYDGSDPRAVKKRYNIPDGVNGININVLARRICQLAHD